MPACCHTYGILDCAAAVVAVAQIVPAATGSHEVITLGELGMMSGGTAGAGLTGSAALRSVPIDASMGGRCGGCWRTAGMALMVADIVADGQIVCVAVSTFAQWLDVLQRGGGGQHMLATHPAGHNAMQLACHRSVDFFTGEGQRAHSTIFCAMSFGLFAG